MKIWSRSTHIWDGYTAFSFCISVCFVCWVLSLTAIFGTDFNVTIHPLHFTFQTSSILMMASGFLPAFYCFVTFPECRSSIWKVSASWKVYATALVVGLCLPFTGYLGTHNPALPWGRPIAIQLTKQFAMSLALSPLWEEIIWRGCVLNKIRPLTSTPGAILLMSIGWTIWHGGYIAYYSKEGFSIPVLTVFVLIAFFTGIVFGSLFILGRGSIWPGVLAHSAFDAAMPIFYADYNRGNELGSYVAELIFVAIAAGLLLRAATRKNRLPASAMSS